jgi:hypothetical protein
MKPLLGEIMYDEFKLKLCGGLKDMYYYSESNSCIQSTAVSCAIGTAGTRRILCKRTSLNLGEFPEENYLPPLHIKLGLMENFLKDMDKKSRSYEYVRNKFPNVSDEKIKEGVFIGA